MLVLVLWILASFLIQIPERYSSTNSSLLKLEDTFPSSHPSNRYSSNSDSSITKILLSLLINLLPEISLVFIPFLLGLWIITLDSNSKPKDI